MRVHDAGCKPGARKFRPRNPDLGWANVDNPTTPTAGRVRPCPLHTPRGRPDGVRGVASEPSVAVSGDREPFGGKGISAPHSRSAPAQVRQRLPLRLSDRYRARSRPARSLRTPTYASCHAVLPSEHRPALPRQCPAASQLAPKRCAHGIHVGTTIAVSGMQRVDRQISSVISLVDLAGLRLEVGGAPMQSRHSLWSRTIGRRQAFSRSGTAGSASCRPRPDRLRVKQRDADDGAGAVVRNRLGRERIDGHSDAGRLERKSADGWHAQDRGAERPRHLRPDLEPQTPRPARTSRSTSTRTCSRSSSERGPRHRGTSRAKLIEQWEHPDALSYVLHVRKGMKWDRRAPTSGRQVNAQDVVDNWNYFADKSFDRKNSWSTHRTARRPSRRWLRSTT